MVILLYPGYGVAVPLEPGTRNEFNAMNIYAYNTTGTPGALFDNILITKELETTAASTFT